MAKRGRKLKQILLTTGDDPSLWRYESLTEALRDNLNLLVDLANAGDNRQPEQPSSSSYDSPKKREPEEVEH